MNAHQRRKKKRAGLKAALSSLLKSLEGQGLTPAEVQAKVEEFKASSK